MDDEFISIAAAARAIGLNKSTLSRQVKVGLIRSQNGKVKLSQVLEDRANNIDASIWEHRQKSGGPSDPRATETSLHATMGVEDEALHATLDPDDEVDEEEGAEVVVDGGAMPLGKAKALKETYLALLRKLEFETKSGRLIDADAAKKMIFDLSRQDRDAWSNWPAQAAPLIAAELGVDLVKLAVILEKYVRQHLSERGDPTLR